MHTKTPESSIGGREENPCSSIPPPPPALGGQIHHRHPICVFVIAVLLLLFGLLEGWIAYQGIHTSSKLYDVLHFGTFGLMFILAAVGLVLWRPGARIAAMYLLILQYISLIATITYRAVHNPYGSTPFEIIVILVTVAGIAAIPVALIIFFLSRKGVKAAFAEKAEERKHARTTESLNLET